MKQPLSGKSPVKKSPPVFILRNASEHSSKERHTAAFSGISCKICKYVDSVDPLMRQITERDNQIILTGMISGANNQCKG